jgi:hypothetical protein
MSEQSKRPHVKRTAFAQQAVDFSDYFGMLFEKSPVKGDVPRHATLVAPEGISTGGGKQGRQALVLKAENEVGTGLTVGWVDRNQRMAALRTYEYLVEQHQQRFGKKPFELDKDSYDAFFKKAQEFFTKEKLPVKVESTVRIASQPPAAPAAKTGGTSSRGQFVLVLVLVFLLAVATTAAVILAMD